MCKMTDRELLQQALEWFEWFVSDDHSVRPTRKAGEIAEAIKARLAQPKKEWVGLTDDEIDSIAVGDDHEILTFARAIEAKLKEKNDLG